MTQGATQRNTDSTVAEPETHPKITPLTVLRNATKSNKAQLVPVPTLLSSKA